ncbi:hypothetical protein FGO68_gene13360 [Halteria grandinella]|uniref:Uncharacterized protein n=1 Tax=Halteria grandinella TaxID=5974 RepID=A0A8J8NI73_HALGN|nr:hypothetical protein FGO68_gene13360 [Halteria grandinella]
MFIESTLRIESVEINWPDFLVIEGSASYIIRIREQSIVYMLDCQTKELLDMLVNRGFQQFRREQTRSSSSLSVSHAGLPDIFRETHIFCCFRHFLVYASLQSEVRWNPSSSY